DRVDAADVIVVIVTRDNEIDAFESGGLFHDLEERSFPSVNVPEERMPAVGYNQVAHTPVKRASHLPDMLREAFWAGAGPRLGVVNPVIFTVNPGKLGQQSGRPIEHVRRRRTMGGQDDVGSDIAQVVEGVEFGGDPRGPYIGPLEIVHGWNFAFRRHQVPAKE